MFLPTVVIAGDCPGANVCSLTDGGVTEICQMHRLGAASDRRLLYFDKVADYHLLCQAGIHPQVSERTDRAIVSNVGIDNQAMVFDNHALAETRVDDARALIDLTGFADDRLPLDVHVRMNDAVAA